MKRDRPRENLLMVRTNTDQAEALKWLRFVLNPNTEIPAVSDWSALRVFAEKQALLGILLPKDRPQNLSKVFLLQWIGQVHMIERQNMLLNMRVKQLFERLEQDGFQCCLLKGQGNADMYPIPLRRCSGDIDIWIDAEEGAVFLYVKKMFPEAEVSYKHIHFPLFEDAPVDVHVTPLKFYSGIHLKRLDKWIALNKPEQFNHHTRLTGTSRDICVPTSKFNVVYLLGHMLIHLFDDGFGMRQVVDYFYVLQSLNVSESERTELADTIKDMGMHRFCRAIMWIESGVLGLPIGRCIVEPDHRRGKQLLEDILEGGNFGHYTQRYKGRDGFYFRGLVEAWRDLTLLPMAPREGIARLFSKIGTGVSFFLKKMKKK